MSIRLIRRPEVERRTGLTASALREAVKHGTFPTPVQIGQQAQAWVLAEVESWINQRITARDQGQQTAPIAATFKAVDHVPAGSRILRREEVLQRTGKSCAALYDDIKRGRFPSPINIGIRRAGWLESEVNEWIAARLKKRTDRAALKEVS